MSGYEGKPAFDDSMLNTPGCLVSTASWGGADGRSAWVSRYADGAFYWALKDNTSAATMSEWRLDVTGDVSDESTSTFEFDLFSRPWFQTPRDASRATWSEPFVWVGGEDSEGMTLGLSYGIPLRDSTGAFLGVIDADFSLNDLSSFLRSVEIGKTGVAGLATTDARLLAAQNDTPVVTSDGKRENAHRTAAEISEMIRDALAQFRGPIGQDDDLTFVIVKVL